jgi:hypothetical protein
VVRESFWGEGWLAQQCSGRRPSRPALRFNKAEMPQATTKGRVLDHIGFDVKDLKAFIKTLEANNIKLDRRYTLNTAGVGLAFITDPWGTYIEMNERPAP